MDAEGWWTWRVSKKEKGLGVAAFLRKKCTEAPSVKALRRAIDSKCCSVNGRLETIASRELEEDDQVALRHASFDVVEQEPTVLFEDEWLLVCNKPSGMVCEGQKLVHRLDKETTGALIFAKSGQVKKAMITCFQKKQVRKVYLAVVDGLVREEKGVIDNFLGEIEVYPGQKVYGPVGAKEGARAITHWKCLEKGNGASLVWCEPRTGRTHQLRVHLSSMKAPILGDTHYGKQFRCPFLPRRHLLHAYQLHFLHPVTKKPLKVIAPIPPDFKQALEALCLMQSS